MKISRGKQFSSYTVLIVIAFIILLPILVGIWLSFLPSDDITAGNYFHSRLTWQNYADAFTTTPIVHYLLNSVWVSGLVMLGQVAFAALAAYAFVFIKFPAKNTIFYLFIATMMLPFEAQLIPNFQTLRNLGWLNNYAGLTIPFLASAFGTFLLRQAFLQIPTELKDAADLEGLGHWQFFTKIVIPYSRLSINTLAAYAFLTTWNMYLWPLITSFNDNVRTAQIGLKQLQSLDTVNSWGLIMASAVIIVLPSLIVLFISQKTFKTGLVDGAIK